MHRETIIVTGSSRGIGKAISLELIHKGYTVHGISRSQSFFDPNYSHSFIDLADLKSLPAHLSSLKSQFLSVKALICNAGKGLFGHIEELSFQEIQSLVSLNFLSQVYLIKTFLPLFKTQESGDIIIIGSESALQGAKQGTIYCATKFALRGFAQALRDECRKNNVRISLINPGFVKSDFFEDLDFSPGDEPYESILPEDIAKVVLSLIEARMGTVFDEITLSPQKKKILKK